MREVERCTGHIGDSTTGLLDDVLAGCMVPDLFAVVGAGRQTEVDRRVAAGDSAVLALTINAVWVGRDAEQLGDLLRLRLVGVSRLDRFAESRLGERAMPEQRR